MSVYLAIAIVKPANLIIKNVLPVKIIKFLYMILALLSARKEHFIKKIKTNVYYANIRQRFKLNAKLLLKP